MFVLVWVLISIGLGLLGVIIGEKIAELIHTLATIAILVPSIALAARRLHDTNKSGWWQLIGLIPFLGWIVVIVFLAQKSDAGSNQYGVALNQSEIKREDLTTDTEDVVESV